MTDKFHLPKGSSVEGPYDLLPLESGRTVAADGRTFERGGLMGVFASATDFAYLPRESEAPISSASGGRFALPSARTERGGLPPRYGRKEDVPVEPRGAGVHGPSSAAPGHVPCHLDVMAGPGQDRARLIRDDPAHGWVRATRQSQDVDDRLPYGAEENA
ncbi:5-deoxy-glucuronate isomerase [Streptomyces cynarae]|uniref:5-deoxy-glucuronate isomerase n=1 Tax=Streptomyces cynarae TaxID=2981134 RepID=UPI00406C9291